MWSGIPDIQNNAPHYIGEEHEKLKIKQNRKISKKISRSE